MAKKTVLSPNTSTKLWVEHCRLRPEHQIQAHRQDTWELTWIQRGSGERIVGEMVRPFAPGEVALVPPGIMHHWRFDPRSVGTDGTISNIAAFIPPSAMCAFTRVPVVGDTIAPLIRAKTPKFVRGTAASHAADMLRRAIESSTATQTALVLAALVTVAEATGDACDMGEKELDADGRLRERIRIFIACNLHRRISLDEIARLVGLSRSSFCARARALFGTTFVDYLNRARIGEAQRQLRLGGTTIAQVAASCGFPDASYFNRIFRRLTGTTPRQQRNKDSSECIHIRPRHSRSDGYESDCKTAVFSMRNQ